MKRWWMIAGIASLVAILGVATVGAVAYAQDDGSSGPFDFGQKFKEAIADILGISVEEYDAAVEQAQGQVVDEALAEGWLTEDQAEMLRWRMEQAPGPGMPGMMGKGFHGLDRGMGGFDRGMVGKGNSLISIAAEKLDMSLTDLLTELQDGKSIADVASEKGVDTQDIVDAYLAELTEDLSEAVDEGRMTQKQADWMLEQASERAVEQLESTWQGGDWGGGRHGGMRGLPGMGGL